MTASRDEDSHRDESGPTEREILDHHRFSLTEVIGRSAGGLLKGTSPITRKRQAELEIELSLEEMLVDAEGALGPALLRRAKANPALVARTADLRPLGVLAQTIRGLLAHEERLRDFVRDVDAEWGRLYGERPHFEVGKHPPDRDDPYTVAGVRRRLETLLASLDESAS